MNKILTHEDALNLSRQVQELEARIEAMTNEWAALMPDTEATTKLVSDLIIRSRQYEAACRLGEEFRPQAHARLEEAKDAIYLAMHRASVRLTDASRQALSADGEKL